MGFESFRVKVGSVRSSEYLEDADVLIWLIAMVFAISKPVTLVGEDCTPSMKSTPR